MKYKTCVTVAEKTPKKMYQTLLKALKKSEYAELRLDFLNPICIPDALDVAKNKLNRCTCTLRPKTEGGKFSGTESERISILKLISEYGPHLIDVEFSTAKNAHLIKYIKKTKTPILVSWHDFKKTPGIRELDKKFAQMKKISKYVKIVTTAKTTHDAFKVLSLYKRSPNGLIAFAMGDPGKVSRVLCLYLGSPYTYTSLGKAIAPGQFSVDDIKKITGLDN